MSLSVVLTRGYAPYEQYHRKGKQGPWTDIYSCGATLYYLLTGTRPEDAIEWSVQDELPGVRDLNTGLGGELSEAIMKALELDVEDRPQSVAEFRHLLSKASAEAGAGSAPSGVTGATESYESPTTSTMSAEVSSSEGLPHSQFVIPVLACVLLLSAIATLGYL